MNQVLYRCAVEVDLVRAMQLAQAAPHSISPHIARADEGVVIKTALAEAFGGNKALRPWMITRESPTSLTVMGNSSAADLQRALDAAPPNAQQMIKDIRDVDPVDIRKGKYRFSVRITPMVSHFKQELDVFKVEAKKQGSARLSREEVYKGYLAQKMVGSEIISASLSSYQTIPRYRNGRSLNMPQALMTGLLKVTDPAAFMETVKAGIGRQRVYGSGWIWLQVAQ